MLVFSGWKRGQVSVLHEPKGAKPSFRQEQAKNQAVPPWALWGQADQINSAQLPQEPEKVGCIWCIFVIYNVHS